MTMRKVTLSVLLVLLTVLAASCKQRPKPGDVCAATDMGHGLCLDPAHALACRAFTWRLDACGGPIGCTPQGAEARCDQRTAAEGDSCGSDDASARACSSMTASRAQIAMLAPARR